MERMFISGMRLEKDQSIYRLYDGTGRQLIAQFCITNGVFKFSYGQVGELVQELILAKMSQAVHS